MVPPRGAFPVRFVSFLLCAGLALSVVEIVKAGCFDDVEVRDPMPFDRAVWDQNPEPVGSVPLRYRMAAQLVADGRLMGKTAAEVEAMLGPPGRDYHTRRKSPAWYLMDWASEKLWLVLDLNEEGVAVEVGIYAGD